MIGGRVRATVRALRGAIAFLTRFPVGSRSRNAGGATFAASNDWEAFCSSPWTFTIVGWIVGALAALVFLASNRLPAASIAFGYPLAVFGLAGIHHLDGVADLGDALVVHGDVDRRRAVMTDTTTGVGALLSVSLVVAGLALGALALAGAPVAVAVGVAVAAEVGAKTGMAAMACFGTAAHEGFGSQLTEGVTRVAFYGPAALAIPAAVLTWPHPAAAAAFAGALAGTALPWQWARRRLGGVSGDVFGAANEVGRLLGVHLGVIAWTLW
ncbi:adenosylcobinamide-GDP ribazoletransferase [Natronosalvus rutilus]|uniref:Adenosylcobinamide-GDP ribazoletransferase n=1 Tax=Natronosalvus rutilus TaxID=2953753 RepID=A0A9E7NE80_9EURY|nr:adenosylcobinamide-GDP ribazoletransferase [Natronosalvus rutilus]UTF55147.1 adenosylcobinamide-GDP ribazoletransferase [Natronosalvus rutilus]